MTAFHTAHADWDANQVFPFVVTKHKSDKIYVDPMWGLKIDSVTADGKAIAAAAHKARFDDLNFNKFPIGSNPFIYLVRRSNLVFAKTFADKGEFELEKWTVPEMTKLLVVKYRLRESPESVGAVLTLESRLA